MASTKDIRRRIRVVKNIQKITNAMKMVAAARLRKAQDRAEAARPYAEKMLHVVGDLADVTASVSHPLLERREERVVVYVIVGGERGLAGSYNSNLMSRSLREMEDRDPSSVKLVVVGRKAVNFFRKRSYEILDTMDSPGSGISFSAVEAITRRLRRMYENAEIDAVKLIYAKFVTPMTQIPTVVPILPMSTPEDLRTGPGDFIFEPSAEKLLASLLPKYLDTQVYQALVESQASEQGARMTAMSAATKNAGEMIESLTLAYNKARQSAITTEILEVVTGAEALS